MRPENHHHHGRRHKGGSSRSPAQDRRPSDGRRTQVDADRYCIDLMHQLAAVQAAISKAAEVILRSQVETYMADTGRNRDERERASAAPTSW